MYMLPYKISPIYFNLLLIVYDTGDINNAHVYNTCVHGNIKYQFITFILHYYEPGIINVIMKV